MVGLSLSLAILGKTLLDKKNPQILGEANP